jgi:2-polyprenyl-3-methyl-5-hydroxy-6-metoxy-1,4-benzoquinol methylase
VTSVQKIKDCKHLNSKCCFKIFSPDKYELARRSFSKNDLKNYLRKWNFCKECKIYYSTTNFALEDKSFYKTNYREVNSFRTNSAEVNFLKIIKLKKNQSETHNRIVRIKKILNKYKIQIKKNFKVLDAGGASGVFAYLFKKNLQLKTIDILDLSVQGNFIKKYNINYINSDIKNFDTRKKYDFISSNFVLEHLKKPAFIINKLKNLLNPNGLLYIEVPSAIAFNHEKSSHDIFNSTHYYIFTKQYFQNLYVNFGFKKLQFNQGINKRGYHYLGVYLKK